ncbi:MAG: hypothetical protein WBL07_05645 [Thiothrix litoralis]|uniref:ISAzo13-like element transposase-related protein n=1 Tax=Thiothrix litoralis TaxID=2891210 RepID=UPI003C736238
MVEKKVDALDAEGLGRAFLSIVGEQTAGDPMREQVRWTNLGAWQIAQRLLEAGYTVSRKFACDNLYRWWVQHGKPQYSDATSILLLCDGGGSNSANHFIFKEDLQKLVERIGVEIRIAHYPPYTSKYNPIEHRLFPPVTRACQGVVFDSLQTVEKRMAKTQTRKGLTAVDKLYLTGRKYAESFKANIPIIFDCHLPKWNYTAVPSIAIA